MKQLLVILCLIASVSAFSQGCPPNKNFPTGPNCSSTVTDNGIYADYMQKDTIYHMLTDKWLPVYVSGGDSCPNPPLHYPCYNGKSMITDWGIYANYVADDSIKAAFKRYSGNGSYSGTFTLDSITGGGNNYSGAIMEVCQYSRVSNAVTVSGQFIITTRTSSTYTSIYFYPPVASSMTGTGVLGGGGAGVYPSGTIPYALYVHPVTSPAAGIGLGFICGTAGTYVVSFTCTYRID